MDCNQTRTLLDADIDGELDLVRHLEIATHLSGCPECTRQAGNQRARRNALRDSLPRFTAPPQLAGQIRAALRVETPPTAGAASVPWLDSTFGSIWRTAALAASLALTLLVGFEWGNSRARANLLLDEAVTDHVRSLQGGHLTDVTSTDQHTVKPWFAGKLDFAPPVVDLAATGFPLAGGRLEQFDGRRAAALVFHRRQHAINLFIWPANAVRVPEHRSGRDGYNTESWTRGDLNFLAVSEIPAGELDQFTAAFRAAAP